VYTQQSMRITWNKGNRSVFQDGLKADFIPIVVIPLSSAGRWHARRFPSMEEFALPARGLGASAAGSGRSSVMVY